MRALILSDVNSIHTRKWVIALASNGITIGLFSLTKPNRNYFNGFENVQVFLFEQQASSGYPEQAYKKHFFKIIKLLNRVIKDFKPNIVHAHYASSYGLLGAMLVRKPFVLSVWGSDVYEFPKRSLFHQILFRFNLMRAQAITSTSHIMAKEVRRYTSKRVDVIPFGVEQSFFEIAERELGQNITIGTIKSLEIKYGIHVLLEAFALVKNRLDQPGLKLRIIGEGSQADALILLAKKLNICNDVEFVGTIAHEDLAIELQNIDVFAALSVDNSESFGVSVVEAMAAGKPIVVSNAGGLKEVIEANCSGLVVQMNDANEAANALIKLIQNKHLALMLGRAAHERALKKYQWKYNQGQMLALYSSLLVDYSFDAEWHAEEFKIKDVFKAA
jgi:glycosyltransferase involved in cell wall biosynthesis